MIQLLQVKSYHHKVLILHSWGPRPVSLFPLRRTAWIPAAETPYSWDRRPGPSGGSRWGDAYTAAERDLSTSSRTTCTAPSSPPGHRYTLPLVIPTSTNQQCHYKQLTICLRMPAMRSRKIGLNIVAAFRGMHKSPAKQLCVTTKKVVTTGHTDTQTELIPTCMCRYASQATQKVT